MKHLMITIKRKKMLSNKTDLIQCAWNNSCGKTVVREMQLMKSGVRVKYLKCAKCGEFTCQDEKGNIIKYVSNEKQN